MTTKYRNGLTNIGLYCGFARDLGNGFIRVQQKSWHRMGLVFALDDGVRGPTHEFEPVTVIFQAIPGRDGEQPTYHALYVTRMGQVSPAVMSQLVCSTCLNWFAIFRN